MKPASICLVVAALVGCAAKPPVWYKAGGSEAEFETDKRYCEYEALKVTQTPDPTLRTAFGQGLDMGMRRRDLTISCLRMKGYTQQ